VHTEIVEVQEVKVLKKFKSSYFDP